MKKFLNGIIDVTTRDATIDAFSGPHWPSRNGNVHITGPAVEMAMKTAASGNPGLEELARHFVAELVELGSVLTKRGEFATPESEQKATKETEGGNGTASA